MNLPPAIARLLTDWYNAGQSGSVTLHIKDGVILKADSTTSIRLGRETHESRASIAGGSGGLDRIGH